ncbi:lipocalin family protein [Marinigracilibium pacificum]|uniref:Lipocalin-like domain-containing protein n=1 Tax=Marinigracilibium pacificum TaxID=2729599 RepID=A0A848IVN6_9BACT|nr:lipocalin family protein [Marinigracilibium pacificum]NMM47345.1 hypothetical protein [Marinigracilibium pacificum]
MKNEKHITLRLVSLLSGIMIAILAMGSCELTELDSGPEDMNGSEITLPTDKPASATEFNELFHGNNQKEWIPIVFTIASIEGMQDCRLDDQININSDGTFTYDGGNQLCGAEDDSRMKAGTWRITEDLSTIVFTEDSNQYFANVEALVSDTLVVSGSYFGIRLKGAYILK